MTISLGEYAKVRFSSKDERTTYIEKERLGILGSFKRYWYAPIEDRDRQRRHLVKEQMRFAISNGYEPLKANKDGIRYYAKALVVVN